MFEAKPKSLYETLLLTNIERYPYIATILLILLTMPASTATTERSFSAMNGINTYVRSTMTTERLSSLAILHIIRELRSTGKRLSQFSHARGQENSILYKDSRLKTCIVFYYFVDICGIIIELNVCLPDYIYLDYFNRRYEINTI